MDDNEIRIKIAKLKGIEYDTYYFPDGGPSHVYHNSNGDIPNWPVNIQDAWELVEEMGLIGMRTYGDTWHCGIYDKYGEQIGYSCSDTAQRAICLAWLSWKEAQG